MSSLNVYSLLYASIRDFIRIKYRAGEARTIIEDSLFALFCTAVVIGFGYFFNNGELRYFQLMGTLSGVLFYAAVLSGIFRKLLNVLFVIFLNFFIKPAKKICRLISIPLSAVSRKIKKFKIRKNKMKKHLLRRFKNGKKRIEKRIKML